MTPDRYNSTEQQDHAILVSIVSLCLPLLVLGSGIPLAIAVSKIMHAREASTETLTAIMSQLGPGLYATHALPFIVLLIMTLIRLVRQPPPPRRKSALALGTAVGGCVAILMLQAVLTYAGFYAQPQPETVLGSLFAFGAWTLPTIMFAWVGERVAGRMWPDRRYCLKCGYDLRGLLALVCPECGASIRANAQTAP